MDEKKTDVDILPPFHAITQFVALSLGKEKTSDPCVTFQKMIEWLLLEGTIILLSCLCQGSSYVRFTTAVDCSPDIVTTWQDE